MDGNILSNYRLGKTLGIGSFGKVKRAVHTLTGLKVAIKILDRQSIDNSAAEKVRREINILRLLSHPHVVRLYEVLETRSNIYVVMEYMDSGELFDYITEIGRLQEDEARHFFQQIISGIEHCHLHMVVHRDLKPENLLLDSKHNVKIADFGLGNIVRDGHFLKTSCGSPNYAAPEVISQRLYAGPEVDVWSCGIILYALVCGRLPFDDDNLPGLYAKIRSGIYAKPSHLSYGAQDLIARILTADPVIRISIPEIRQHPWFREHLPQYIAHCPINVFYSTKTIDKDVVEDMIRIGFGVQEVMESLRMRLQNEATVTYYMLLHDRLSKRCIYERNEPLGSLEGGNQPEIYMRSSAPIQGQWALGFKSQASPHETMTNVLRVFHCLNVQWKKIGHYNMKCLWLPPLSDNIRAMLDDGAQTKHTWGHDLSVTTASKTDAEPHDAVKFEIQLYKGSEELYVVDLQRISGPPFLFLEVCAAFFSRVVT